MIRRQKENDIGSLQHRDPFLNRRHTDTQFPGNFGHIEKLCDAGSKHLNESPEISDISNVADIRTSRVRYVSR